MLILYVGKGNKKPCLTRQPSLVNPWGRIMELRIYSDKILASKIMETHKDLVEAATASTEFIYNDKGQCVDTLHCLNMKKLKLVRFNVTFGQGVDAGQGFDIKHTPCLVEYNGFGFEYFTLPDNPARVIAVRDTLPQMFS